MNGIPESVYEAAAPSAMMRSIIDRAIAEYVRIQDPGYFQRIATSAESALAHAQKTITELNWRLKESTDNVSRLAQRCVIAENERDELRKYAIPSWPAKRAATISDSAPMTKVEAEFPRPTPQEAAMTCLMKANWCKDFPMATAAIANAIAAGIEAAKEQA